MTPRDYTLSSLFSRVLKKKNDPYYERRGAGSYYLLYADLYDIQNYFNRYFNRAKRLLDYFHVFIPHRFNHILQRVCVRALENTSIRVERSARA